MLDEDQRSCKECQRQPDIEVEQEISDIVVPWLSTIYIRPFTGSGKDVVRNNIPGNTDEFPVKENIDAGLDGLDHDFNARFHHLRDYHIPAQ
jgi:hypothetical protein